MTLAYTNLASCFRVLSSQIIGERNFVCLLLWGSKMSISSAWCSNLWTCASLIFPACSSKQQRCPSSGSNTPSCQASVTISHLNWTTSNWSFLSVPFRPKYPSHPWSSPGRAPHQCCKIHIPVRRTSFLALEIDKSVPFWHFVNEAPSAVPDDSLPSCFYTQPNFSTGPYTVLLPMLQSETTFNVKTNNVT